MRYMRLTGPSLKVSTLSRANLYEVLAYHPVSAKLVQEAGLKMAFARAMTVISLYARAKKTATASFISTL